MMSPVVPSLDTVHPGIVFCLAQWTFNTSYPNSILIKLIVCLKHIKSSFLILSHLFFNQHRSCAITTTSAAASFSVTVERDTSHVCPAENPGDDAIGTACAVQGEYVWKASVFRQR